MQTNIPSSTQNKQSFVAQINLGQANKWGLSLNLATVFDYVFQTRFWAKPVDKDDNPFRWVSLDKITSDLSDLSDKTNTIWRWLDQLAKKGLIEYLADGSKSLIRVVGEGLNWSVLASSGQSVKVKPPAKEEPEKSESQVGQPSEGGSDSHPSDYIYLDSFQESSKGNINNRSDNVVMEMPMDCSDSKQYPVTRAEFERLGGDKQPEETATKLFNLSVWIKQHSNINYSSQYKFREFLASKITPKRRVKGNILKLNPFQLSDTMPEAPKTCLPAIGEAIGDQIVF